MGAWWPFGATHTPAKSPSSENHRLSPASPPPTGTTSVPDEASSPTKPLSRDEQAQAELDELIRTLNTPDLRAATVRSSVTNTAETGLASTTDAEDSLYPSTLSCRAAFDSAYYCQSLGGQFNAVYRFGTLKSCSDHWAQWRFCMRLKTVPEEQKAERVQRWYKEREAKVRAGRNSEEVWSIRKGDGDVVIGAFSRDPDEADEVPYAKPKKKLDGEVE